MAQVNEQMIADIVRQVLRGVNGSSSPSSSVTASSCGITAADYPLGVRRRDLLKSPRGIPFEELTLENIEKGKVGFEDFSITPEVLKMQGDIAAFAGRTQIALNLGRAGELTKLPDTRVLEIYNALRPHRSTKDELLAIADELQTKFGANVCANFVREAADVYQRRKLLKGDLPSSD
jgi:propanediol dehydratase small subunit